MVRSTAPVVSDSLKDLLLRFATLGEASLVEEAGFVVSLISVPGGGLAASLAFGSIFSLVNLSASTLVEKSVFLLRDLSE